MSVRPPGLLHAVATFGLLTALAVLHPPQAAPQDGATTTIGAILSTARHRWARRPDFSL